MYIYIHIYIYIYIERETWTNPIADFSDAVLIFALLFSFWALAGLPYSACHNNPGGVKSGRTGQGGAFCSSEDLLRGVDFAMLFATSLGGVDLECEFL